MEDFITYLILPVLLLATIAFIVVAASRFYIIRKAEKLLKEREEYLKQERKFLESEKEKNLILQEVYPFSFKFYLGKTVIYNNRSYDCTSKE